MMCALLLGFCSLVARDGKVCAVEGPAVEHERSLGCGRLLEVDSRGVLLLVELDLADLPTEPASVLGKLLCQKYGPRPCYLREEVSKVLLGRGFRDARDLRVPSQPSKTSGRTTTGTTHVNGIRGHDGGRCRGCSGDR